MPQPYAATRAYAGVSASERAASRRGLFVDAAVELFGTRGYASTGVKDLCRAAGVTDRYFYESFRSRAELFTAAFDRAVGELFAAVATAVAEVPPNPAAQASAAVDTFVRAVVDDPRRARLLFVEATVVGGEVERHVRASIRRFAELIAATARSHVDGDLPDQLVTMGALSLVGAIQLVLIEWLDGTLDATIDEVIDYFVEMLLVAGAARGLDPRAATRRGGSV
jgi:AcrR family transcriptional regulator